MEKHTSKVLSAADWFQLPTSWCWGLTLNADSAHVQRPLSQVRVMAAASARWSKGSGPCGPIRPARHVRSVCRIETSVSPVFYEHFYFRGGFHSNFLFGNEKKIMRWNLKGKFRCSAQFFLKWLDDLRRLFWMDQRLKCIGRLRLSYTERVPRNLRLLIQSVDWNEVKIVPRNLVDLTWHSTWGIFKWETSKYRVMFRAIYGLIQSVDLNEIKIVPRNLVDLTPRLTFNSTWGIFFK